MNELLVMRHAKSDWTAGHADFDRPLNDRGIRAADRMAGWLLDEQLCPDHVISSPAARARATAMAVVSLLQHRQSSGRVRATGIPGRRIHLASTRGITAIWPDSDLRPQPWA